MKSEINLELSEAKRQHINWLVDGCICTSLDKDLHRTDPTSPSMKMWFNLAEWKANTTH